MLSTFFLPGFSTDAYATNAPGTLGVCNIENPTYDVNGSTYNRVYFGKTPSKAEDTNDIQLFRRQYPKNASGQAYILHDNPIYWRVLNTTANDTAGTPALFMLTEYCITNNMSWDNNPKKGTTDASTASNYSQRWLKAADTSDNNATTDCAIKIFLNGQAGGEYNKYNGTKDTSVSDTKYNSNANTTGAVYATENPTHCAYNDCFDEEERNVIMSTHNGETSNYNTSNRTNDDTEWYSSDNYAYGCGLNGEKLFLLSAKEAITEGYGFRNEWRGNNSSYYDVNKRTRQYDASESSRGWWLRSASSSGSHRVAYVYYSGYSYYYASIDANIAVRFALNIPLSSVLCPLRL